MSKIFDYTKSKEMEFTANQDMDDARNMAYPDTDMAYVKVNFGVTGNAKGQIKTSGAQSGRATGGSFSAGFGSDYCVADVTVPFTWEYAKQNQSAIMKIIADIQNKMSVMATRIQGQLDASVEKKLRESAMRSRAIREAKSTLAEDDSSVFDKAAFQRANQDVRAKVISDMSLSAGVRSTFSIRVGSTQESWALSKGYVKVSGKSIYTIGADEKGLKKIYLVDADMVERATNKVYEVGSAWQAKITEAMKSKEWDDDLALSILRQINDAINEDPNGIIKDIPEFTAEEEAKICEWRDSIIDKYNSIMED